MKFYYKAFFVCILFFPVFLNSSIQYVRADLAYEFDFQENFYMIYEYTNVDKDALMELSEFDSSYENLTDIKEGSQMKMVISSFQDREDSWFCSIDRYGGDKLSDFLSDFEMIIYKDPSDLSNDLLNNISSNLLILPENHTDYLWEVADSLYSDELYDLLSSFES